MPAGPLAIRSALPGDSEALYEICLKTAANGKDASTFYGDPRLPGAIWAAPYGVLEPDLAFVLASPQNVIGYVLGTGNSQAFSRRLEQAWWPDLRRAFSGFEPRTAQDEAALRYIEQPETAPDWLSGAFPAHLHINVLPEAQAGGWGRRLIETELAAMRAKNIGGVHVGLAPGNKAAPGFYRRLGFEDISRDGKVLFGLKL